MARDYPLHAARTVRATAREVAQAALVTASEALVRARAELDATRARLATERSAEKERRERACAPRTAAALLREQRYRDAMESRERGVLALLEAARRAEQEARRGVERARKGLGGALVEEKVLDRHHERWAHNESKLKMKKEEDELEDRNPSRASEGRKTP